MKKIFIFSLLLGFSFTAQANLNVNSCSHSKIQDGVDIWPWSVAQPFPWDNIQGYWQLGDDQFSFLRAEVVNPTNKRKKILSLSIHDGGPCSAPIAKGTGYIHIAEKNVVVALITDGVYQYRLKIAKFNSSDITGLDGCPQNIVGVTAQVIGHVKKSNDKNLDPIDPSITEPRNMVLKKTSANVDELCKKIN